MILSLFIHEMGHSIHNELIKPLKLRQYIEIPAETAELASMTMELFSLNWDTFYTDKKDLKQAKINFFKRCYFIFTYYAYCRSISTLAV